MKNSFFDDWGEKMVYLYQSSSCGATMPTNHLHPHYEIYFCPHPIAQKIIVNAQEYYLNEPNVVISSPYTLHSMSSLEQKNYERFVFYFGRYTIDGFHSRFFPENLFNGNSQCIIGLDCTLSASLRNLIFDPMMHPDKYSDQEKDLIFALFLTRLFQSVSAEQITWIDNKNFYIQDVLRYVSGNFRMNISSEDIVRKFSVSRSKLDRDFQNTTGYTLHDYLDNCRLCEAVNLLRKRNKTKYAYKVEEVARLCGFNNESYFYRFFKKYTGMSPLELRAQKEVMAQNYPLS